MVKRIRFVMLRAGLVLLGLLAALPLAELALHLYPVPNRIAMNQQLVRLWESDDATLMRLRPNLDETITAHPEFRFTVRTNSQGWRGSEWAGEPVDVVAIGDSFTFGFGVEGDEAWPSRLADATGWGVVNLGWADGWTPYVYPAAVERLALPLQAKVWVVTFFVNDMLESVEAEDYLTSGKVNYYEEKSAGLDLSFPFNLRLLQLMAVMLNPDLALLQEDETFAFNKGDLALLISRYAWNRSDPADPDVARGWALSEDGLRRIQALATANDVHLLVAYIPPIEEVY